MRTIVGRVPFRILGGHGVPPEQIAVLEYRFGPLFPTSIEGPDDVIEWALALLPWSEQAPVLKGWVEKAFKKGEVDPRDDHRARRVLAALDGPPKADHKTEDEIHELTRALARCRGIPLADDSNGAALSKLPNFGDDLRAWAAGWSAIAAAGAAASGKLDSDAADEAAYAVYKWVTSQSENHNRSTDRCLQEVVAQVAAFVGGWAGDPASA